MKKAFYISVTETLNKVIAVDAETFEEAYMLVEEAANSGEVELTAEDFVDRDFANETEETEDLIKDGIVSADRYQKIIRK